MRPDGWDGVIALGVISLEAGLWLWSPALALVVFGCVLIVLGVAGATRKGRSRG